MYSKLFHKDVYLPKDVNDNVIKLQKAFKNYKISKHLQEHLSRGKDRSHNYLGTILNSCLNTISSNPQEPFEVELSKDYHLFGTSSWMVTKYCVRIPYNKKQDIVVAIRPRWNKDKNGYDFEDNFIVTAWLNANNDTHITLDAKKYCSEEEWNNL